MERVLVINLDIGRCKLEREWRVYDDAHGCVDCVTGKATQDWL